MQQEVQKLKSKDGPSLSARGASLTKVTNENEKIRKDLKKVSCVTNINSVKNDHRQIKNIMCTKMWIISERNFRIFVKRPNLCYYLLKNVCLLHKVNVFHFMFQKSWFLFLPVCSLCVMAVTLSNFPHSTTCDPSF